MSYQLDDLRNVLESINCDHGYIYFEANEEDIIRFNYFGCNVVTWCNNRGHSFGRNVIAVQMQNSCLMINFTTINNFRQLIERLLGDVEYSEELDWMVYVAEAIN